MTPRPFYRWKSFWFGILVLLSIGWAWVYSVNNILGMSWKDSRVFCFANQFGGRVNLRMDLLKSHSLGFRLGKPNGFHLRDQNHDSLNIPDPVIWPSNLPWGINLFYDKHALVSIGVAHWFLILVFLVPWTVFLLWRRNRMKRMAGPEGH